MPLEGIDSRPTPRRLGVMAAVWGASVAVGLGGMAVYEMTPGATDRVASNWPAASRIFRDPALPTLVMFVHPHCPCSRASLAELEKLASQCRGQAAIRVVFIRPQKFADGWEQTDLWRTAQRIAGAEVTCDESGAEVRQFGATISGECLLYGAAGQLLFRGGVTGGRGHQGDNPGRTAVAALIQQRLAEPAETVVFGCALTNRCCSPSETPSPCDR